MRHALETLAAGPGASRTKLVSTYYDTADHVLARHGLTLRVRKQRRRFFQTVKSSGPSGGSMLGRGEWEDRIAHDRPSPHAPHSGRFLSGGIADRLLPVFRTEITRLAIPLAPAPRTRIEAAIDRGKIRTAAHARVEPIREIELELKSGSATALYDVALQLLAIAPVRLEWRSKSLRGYRLAAGKADAPEAVYADALDLDPALSGEEALQWVGHACVTQLLGNEAAAVGGEAEGIHQMRVALRRFRAILSAFGKLIPPERRGAIDEELRWLAKALGEARNFDVFAGDLLGPARATQIDGPAFDRLVKAAERRRRAAYSTARRAILSPRYTGLLLRLMRWFDGRAWRGSTADDAAERLKLPVGELAPALLDRRQRTARKRGKGFADQSPQQRHKLRIALKKLRYTTELFGGLYASDETQRFTKSLKRLQDELGEANDVRVGREIVAELTPPRVPTVAQAGQRVLAWHERRIAEAEPKLRDQMRRLRRAKPFWRDQPAVDDGYDDAGVTTRPVEPG